MDLIDLAYRFWLWRVKPTNFLRFERSLSYADILILQASLEATWNQAKHQGFWATWAQLVDLTDPRGEINAYKVGQPFSVYSLYKKRIK